MATLLGQHKYSWGVGISELQNVLNTVQQPFYSSSKTFLCGKPTIIEMQSVVICAEFVCELTYVLRL